MLCQQSIEVRHLICLVAVKYYYIMRIQCNQNKTKIFFPYCPWISLKYLIFCNLLGTIFRFCVLNEIFYFLSLKNVSLVNLSNLNAM